MNLYRKYIKPLFDILAAAIGLVIFSPLFVVVAILLMISFKGTPFFLQERGGKNKSVFKIIKFKSMNDNTDEHGNLLPDSERMTPLGNFVRNISLDELPQLINVLKGDMSLIGPRPMLAEYLTIYNEQQVRRLEVKPGITGWAQVNGRNNLTFNEKFKYDIWYIDNLSLTLDIKILLLTLVKVFRTLDVNQDDDLGITAEKFNGKN